MDSMVVVVHTPPPSAGASSANLRDSLSNMPEQPEQTSRDDVLGSDVLINESHSLFTMAMSHTPVSTQSKQNLMSFSAANAHNKSVANIVDPRTMPLVVDNIPPWSLPTHSRGIRMSESTPSTTQDS